MIGIMARVRVSLTIVAYSRVLVCMVTVIVMAMATVTRRKRVFCAA